MTGPTPINALDEAITARLADTADDTSSVSSSSAGDAFPTTLGSCLLAGCGLGSLEKQQAADVWREWEAATSAGEDPMDVLQRLPPTWQQLPGLDPLSRTQQAGLYRLRGLVQLATAAATLGQPPRQVLQVSKCSGNMDITFASVFNDQRVSALRIHCPSWQPACREQQCHTL